MSMPRTTLLLTLGALVACSASTPADADPPLPPPAYAPLGAPLADATPSQRASFERGREVAQRRFTPSGGLGPLFNVTACGSCHEKPVIGGGAGRYRDFLLVGSVQPDGVYIPTGTNGVQNQFGTRPQDADGVEARIPTSPDTNHFASRNTTPFFGVGLLATVSEEEILRRADPDDDDGDGISGRPNYDRGYVGRFGRKAQTVSLEGFVRGPLFNHLGITSNPLPEGRKAQLPVPSARIPVEPPGAVAALQLGALDVGVLRQAQVAAPDEPTLDDDGVPDPELSEDALFDLVSFTMLLAPPPPAAPTPSSQRGRALFDEVGCEACHTASLKSAQHTLPAFSDLLLHDMGEALADGVPMGVATGHEFRTQPLWGVVATAPYLHDGRAANLDEAIRWHGGEALNAREAYLDLNDPQREDILNFLAALGGAEQVSAGLLPPDAPVPAPGEPGGPREALEPADLARFVRGRALFDRDMGEADGLGPRFNGDSCRGCHLDPVIGGAGPADVDVIRHGRCETDTEKSFTAPERGTLLHRFDNSGVRPEPDSASNCFERRQTPTLLGAGLIDAIPESALLALEDPDDLDGDGIRGVARRLSDGRIGRFGWKAGQASLEDFAQDALTNELGLGTGTSAELDPTQLSDLNFFMSQLAAPTPDTPKSQTEPGALLFTQIGCANCHLPTQFTAAGEAVPLYSDLLLHEVAEGLQRGIADGDVTGAQLRTPPLWGLGSTAPYWHDGRAETIAVAIEAHAGEAAGSRRRFMALDQREREALLTFLRTL